MTSYNLDKRMQEIKDIHKKYPLTYPLVIAGMIVAVMIIIGANFIENFGKSFYIDVINIILTVGILDVLTRYRERKRQIQINSIVNSNYARNANQPETHHIFFEMMVHGSLSGYITSFFDLQDIKCQTFDVSNAGFENCNLRNSSWRKIDFSCSKFDWCNLTNAQFLDSCLDRITITSSHLDSARLIYVSAQEAKLKVNMEKARLHHVNLQDADLSESSLEGSILIDVNLRGTNLYKVNLEGVHFMNAHFNAFTKLPDGSFYNPTQDSSQLARFVNPARPDFFRVTTIPYHMSGLPGMDKPDIP